MGILKWIGQVLLSKIVLLAKDLIVEAWENYQSKKLKEKKDQTNEDIENNPAQSFVDEYGGVSERKAVRPKSSGTSEIGNGVGSDE